MRGFCITKYDLLQFSNWTDLITSLTNIPVSIHQQSPYPYHAPLKIYCRLQTYLVQYEFEQVLSIGRFAGELLHSLDCWAALCRGGVQTLR